MNLDIKYFSYGLNNLMPFKSTKITALKYTIN
jgi:hypothetical protein